MAVRQSRTNTPDAGDAPDYSPNSSPDRGESAVPAAKRTTVHPNAEALLETLLNGSDYRERGPKCGVTVVLDSMNEEHSTKFRYLIDDTDRSAVQISEVLHLLGYKLSFSQIRHHRNRKRGSGCKCPA